MLVGDSDERRQPFRSHRFQPDQADASDGVAVEQIGAETGREKPSDHRRRDSVVEQDAAADDALDRREVHDADGAQALATYQAFRVICRGSLRTILALLLEGDDLEYLPGFVPADDFFIGGDQRQAENHRRCDDDTVRRVAMEIGKPTTRGGDFRGNRREIYR